MSAPLEEEFAFFSDVLNQSEYTKEECIVILSEYVNSIFDNFVPLANRPYASITTSDYIKRLRNNEWKFPHGFIGNWAKSIEDDQDVGC